MPAIETAQSHGERRRARYCETAAILWDERVLLLFKETGVGDYAPSGASLEEAPDDAPDHRHRVVDDQPAARQPWPQTLSLRTECGEGFA